MQPQPAQALRGCRAPSVWPGGVFWVPPSDWVELLGFAQKSPLAKLSLSQLLLCHIMWYQWCNYAITARSLQEGAFSAAVALSMFLACVMCILHSTVIMQPLFDSLSGRQ